MGSYVSEGALHCGSSPLSGKHSMSRIARDTSTASSTDRITALLNKYIAHVQYRAWDNSWQAAQFAAAVRRGYMPRDG
jgi:hypothetical protein